VAKRKSRTIIIVSVLVLVAGALAYALWPQPALVDIAEVRLGTLIVSIEEEGRTLVRDTYIVSSPVTGRLLRVDMQPGAEVVKGVTVVARVLAARPGGPDILGPDGEPVPGGEEEIVLKAPASGRILRVMQQSETMLAAGTPIMEIGDIERDLEVVVELLSTDAVQVDVGDRVIIDNWGGDRVLGGVVTRIDPFGFSKFSSLGVEEQRVVVSIEFTGPATERQNLGHGFRVEVKIVIFEQPDAVLVPSGALFRQDVEWAVFLLKDGVARVRTVEIGRSNGIEASVVTGLQPGDKIVLYPSSQLKDGDRVAQRLTN